MLLLLSILVMSILVGCSPYRFQSKAHFIDGVDEYFNLKSQRNIWVYMNFVSPMGDAYGVRTDRFYTDDRAVLDHVGLKGRDMRTLFSAVPKSRMRYHLLVLEHKSSKFAYDSYEEIVNKKSRYYQQDYQLDSLDIRHVVIPYGKKRKLLSMVYYIEKEANQAYPLSKLQYLADINAQELQEGKAFTESWQVFDCHSYPLIQHKVLVDRELIKKHALVYLKMYTHYGNDLEINYAKILTRKNREDLQIKLCPNRYQLVYLLPDGSVIGKTDFEVE